MTENETRHINMTLYVEARRGGQVPKNEREFTAFQLFDLLKNT